MTTALCQTTPADISKDARQVGRPLGTFDPKTRWLRGVIAEMRRSEHGCADVFRRLCLTENPGPMPQSFCVSSETADEMWEEIGGDIRGQVIRFEAFKKLWQRT